MLSLTTQHLLIALDVTQLIVLKTQSECQALEKILEGAGEIAELKHKWRKDE